MHVASCSLALARVVSNLMLPLQPVPEKGKMSMRTKRPTTQDRKNSLKIKFFGQDNPGTSGPKTPGYPWTQPWEVPDCNFIMQGAFSCCVRQGMARMSREFCRDVPGFGCIASQKRCDFENVETLRFLFRTPKYRSDFSAIFFAIFWRFLCDFCIWTLRFENASGFSAIAIFWDVPGFGCTRGALERLLVQKLHAYLPLPNLNWNFWGWQLRVWSPTDSLE